MCAFAKLWPTAREDQLRELWSSKLSAREIAATMGGFDHMPDKGRNAVLGKAYRMKLPSRLVPIDPEVRRRRAIAGLEKSKARQEKLEKVSNATANEAAPFHEFVGVKFEDLRLFSSIDPNQCRFINGDAASPIYCGGITQPGKPYCAHHHSVTHGARIKITEQDRARRKAHAAKVWFGATVKLHRAPAEAA